MNILIRNALLLWIAACLAVSHGRLHAQVDVADYFPNDVRAVVNVRPALMASRDRLAILPLEVATAAGLEYIGIDPLKLTRCDLLIGTPTINGPVFGMIVQSSDPIDLSKLSPEFVQPTPVTDDDFESEIRVLRFDDSLVITLIDEKTALVGARDYILSMLNNGGSRSSLTELLATDSATTSDVFSIIALEQVRPMFRSFLPILLRQAPEEIATDILSLFENIDTLTLQLDLESTNQLNLAALCQDEQVAKESAEALIRILEESRQMSLDEMRRSISNDSQTALAFYSYMERLSSQMTNDVAPKLNGNRFELTIDYGSETAITGVLVGLLLPAVQQARFAARRMQAQNNIKQMTLAILNFESAYRLLPSLAILDEAQEKPLLSWRVTILPFIEENELFQEFHLDEPWDSEHNLSLLPRMPDVFKTPNQNELGKTVFQAVSGEDSALRQTETTRFANITDGTSNTIWIVKTLPENAVPWTAPQDYQYDPANPAAGLVRSPDDTFEVGMVDGSVRNLSGDISIEILKALFTRSSGEIVDPDDF